MATPPRHPRSRREPPIQQPGQRSGKRPGATTTPSGAVRRLLPAPSSDREREFFAATAAEQLWYVVARVEALAQATSQALESLPLARDPAGRRATERLHLLVVATAEASAVALDAVEAQLSGIVRTDEPMSEK